MSLNNRHNQNNIKAKFERGEKALTLKPTLGIDTLVSTTKVTKGLACHTQEGDWGIVTDMPREIGGGETGPTPGMLGRSALGSCLAMGFMLWASKLEVSIENIEVEVQADSDDSGLFGINGASAGYSEIRYLMRIQSSASEDDIQKVLDKVNEHDPYLDNFSRAIPCVRSVEIIAPEKSS
jgi:uncharacterized OsmC-like protein